MLHCVVGSIGDPVLSIEPAQAIKYSERGREKGRGEGWSCLYSTLGSIRWRQYKMWHKTFWALSMKGIYQVQTNLIVQTSIWIIGSTSKGQRRGSGRGDLQKCDSRRAVNCKIIQSPMPLGCWSGGPDWSLHEEVGLHLICSHVRNGG